MNDAPQGWGASSKRVFEIGQVSVAWVAGWKLGYSFS